MPDPTSPEDDLVGRLADRRSDLGAATDLLDAELHDARWRDLSYLAWLYDANPFGPGFYASADPPRPSGPDPIDAGDRGRMAHYAVVPQEYRDHDGPGRMVFSLNAVTRSGAQRKGWFTAIGHRIYAEAAEWGAHGVIGVSNENSTPPVVKKLDFRLLGPLPVRLAVPRPGRHADADEHPVDTGFLESASFEVLAADLDAAPADGWTNRMTPTYLRWRLAAPNMASPYTWWVTDDLVAVTAVHQVAGRTVPVILKLAPRGRPGRVLAADGLVATLARRYRSPMVVYAGFNRWVRLRGLRPPRRLQPAPLNLIYRSLSPRAPKHGFRLDTFEFLDMDAY